MKNDIENREKEIFEKTQEKQARLVKKILLGVFSGIGFIFALIGTIFILLGDILGEIGIIFLPLGLGFIALGIILFFVIPTKYDYNKYKERVKKYGYMNMYELSLKINELEARIEELENMNNDRF